MYKPRLKAPAPNNVLWTKKNPFFRAGYGLPNCTAYVWGRWYELIGKAPKLSLGNAGDWYKNIKDGYERGDTPRVGRKSAAKHRAKAMLLLSRKSIPTAPLS